MSFYYHNIVITYASNILLVLLQSEDLLIISTLIIIRRFTRLIFMEFTFKCHQLSSNLIKMDLRLHKSFILEEWSKVQKLSRSSNL